MPAPVEQTSARRRTARARRRTAYEYLPSDAEQWGFGFEAQRTLARTGPHRAVGIADLLVCELAFQRWLVLHSDADVAVAAEVVDFGHRWVALPGTI